MSHYYQNDPTLGSEIKQLKYTYRGHELTFNADLGVFSKDRVDFGTNVLLNSLPAFKNGKSILDMGCGYGIIGLAIAKSNSTLKVTACDCNERAVNLTKENAQSNKINNLCTIVSDLYSEVEGNFDYIISNPPIRAGKKIVHSIIEEGYNHLNANGCIIVVIQKKQGAPSMKLKMEEVFKNCETLDKVNGYFIYSSHK